MIIFYSTCAFGIFLCIFLITAIINPFGAKTKPKTEFGPFVEALRVEAPATVELKQKIVDPSLIDLSTDGMDFTPGVFSLEGMFEEVMLKESEPAGDEYINDIVFVGESTTYGLYHYGVLPRGKETKHVWTPTSGTLMLTNANAEIGSVNVYNEGTGAYEDMLIKDAAALYKPKYMLITLGLNGVSFYIDSDSDYYIGEYVKLLNSIMEVSPETKIIVQSVFPVAADYEYADSISNERLNKANYLFAKMCSQMGVKFLYSAPIFMDENGNLNSDYDNGDGLHLNEATLQKEIDFIKRHEYV